MESPHAMPLSGTDYPSTWTQFLDWFHSEDACRAYLEKLRWPVGLICPKCGTIDEADRSSRSRLVCRSCKHQTTVTTGTIFDKTRTELRVWFAAIWYITNQKHGISPDRDLLKGEVEVDETYLSLTDRKSPISSERRKSNTTKLLVAIAVEMLQPKGFGRIRIRRIDEGDYENLMPFLRESVRLGSVIHSDGSAAYRELEEAGYGHRRTVHLGSDIPAHESMPGVHRVAALLQRWILGTHHGAVQPKQLDYYLDEFVFRFNRRASKSRGLLFYRLLQQAVVTNPVTYNAVIGKKSEKSEI